jgi:hypothetical protein
MKNQKETHGKMWKISCITFCFVAFSLLSASYAFSKCEFVGTQPWGSYRDSCKYTCYDSSSDTLKSECNTGEGTVNKTQLNNASQCKKSGGDIANCKGMLDCIGANLPNVGSYKKSCWCCKMIGTSDSLACYCKPKKGNSKLTVLDNARSFSDIWNDDGKLKGKK